MKLIWCQGGNKASSKLAVDYGWYYGSRSDESIASKGTHKRLYLLDINWKNYDWMKHLCAAAFHKPWIGAVPDLEDIKKFDFTLKCANELSKFCDKILIIPKIIKIIKEIPNEINGKEIILGYSIPTSYGGTNLLIDEFNNSNKNIHLLGGTSKKQAEYIYLMKNIISIDGNVTWRLARSGIPITIDGVGSKFSIKGTINNNENMPLIVLKQSFENLKIFWSRRFGSKIEWNLNE